MCDLRPIVAAVISGAPFPSKRSQNKAIDILDAIEAAGYRILGPDEVDAVTLERAVVAAEERAEWVPLKAGDMASAIRAIGRKA